MAQSRQYELVLFGATGYTGKLTAEWISQHLPTDLKWAIAGRNPEKLQDVVAELKRLSPDRKQPGKLRWWSVGLHVTCLLPRRVMKPALLPRHLIMMPALHQWRVFSLTALRHRNVRAQGRPADLARTEDPPHHYNRGAIHVLWRTRARRLRKDRNPLSRLHRRSTMDPLHDPQIPRPGQIYRCHHHPRMWP